MYVKTSFFCSPDALNNHMSTEHRNKPVWICILCDKGSFKTEHALQLQKIKVHSLWRELNSCNVCETSLITIVNGTGNDQSNQKIVAVNYIIEEVIILKIVETKREI